MFFSDEVLQILIDFLKDRSELVSFIHALEQFYVCCLPSALVDEVAVLDLAGDALEEG